MSAQASQKAANHPEGQFEWSAFGANYPDTECVDGVCADLDADWSTNAGIPCPFCNSSAFFEYQWGGGWIVPTCYECQEKLPSKTPLTFHDGPGLTFSADCPKCQAHATTLMREYDTDRDDVEVWEA
jgi:hypothetical protein